MTRLVFDNLDEAALSGLGRRIGAHVRVGDLVALSGPLGAGKTTLARAALQALTGDPGLEVPSPTYTLVQPYDGPGFSVCHLDLYRIESAEEAWALGLEDMLAEGAALIEWPERMGLSAGQPGPRGSALLFVSIEFEGAGRRMTVEGDAAWESRLGELD